ncbi:MAG: hypothetical protein KGZ83_06850 [Sulfuricella sp.]|nr:hypothetical protein [Sulfuricella sp.]
MRILVAEKDHNYRKLLDQMLKMEGHEVLAAENGEHAMVIMSQFRPHVVLMNMFSSMQACRQPTSADGVSVQTSTEPVVFMTAGGGEDFLAGFMGGDEERSDAFDRLPTRAKISAVEQVQQLCGALSRCERLAAQERRLMRSHLGYSVPDFVV